MTIKLNIAKIVYEDTDLTKEEKVDILTITKYIKEEDKIQESTGTLTADKIYQRVVHANDRRITGKDIQGQIRLALKK